MDSLMKSRSQRNSFMVTACGLHARSSQATRRRPLGAVGRGDGRRDLFQSNLLLRIVAAHHNLPGCVPLLAGFGKAGVGIDAERQRILLAKGGGSSRANSGHRRYPTA